MKIASRVKPNWKRWHAEDGVLGVWSASIWKLIYERPFTFAGILIALVVLTRPQVNHVVLGVLWPTEASQGVLTIVYGVGVALLFAAAVCGMVLVMPPDGELSDADIEKLPWYRRAIARFTRWLSHHAAIVDLYTAVDRWFHEREAAGARHIGRSLIGGGLIVAAFGVWLWGALGGGACRWAALSRRLLLALGLGLSAAWFLLGHRDPEGPRRRALGRYGLMTLVGLVTGELLWCLPNHGRGWFSFRFYTIWAILFLLFVVVATGRLIDRTALRARVVLVLAVLLVTRLTSGFAVDTRAERGGEAIARAHREEAEEWFQRLEARIGGSDRKGPVVLVAASGGGSRAAMFASLVYEFLNHVTFTGQVVEPGPNTIAANIAVASGVSGGSLATAHYLAHPDTERRNPARNFTPAEIARGIQGFAEQYARGDRCPKPDNPSHVARYNRACERVGDEVRQLPARGPRVAPWLLESAFVDDMATDFMAPLLRGVLTPFLERGHSVSDFWAERFGWDGTFQRSCLSGATEWPCPWSAGGKAPLLAMLNATNVEDGGRVVIGYPPVPSDLLGNGATSLSDFGGAHDLALADGARLSANFPWGFEVGLFSTKSYTFVVPDAIKLTDGGVTDNTGIDTLATLLEAIQRRAEPPNTNAVPAPGSADELYAKHARIVRNLLVERGVMLIEIDSGARPERSGVLETLIPAVTEPLDAMSLASFGGATTIKTGHIARIRAALADMAAHRDPAAASAPPPFQHVPFVCNYADTIMTAWALGPEDKAAVMTRFLVEAEANSEMLERESQHTQQLNRSLAILAKLKSHLLPATAETQMANNVIQDLREGEDERGREDSSSFGPQPAGSTPPDGVDAPRAAPAGNAGRQGWIYLGQYDADTARWTASSLQASNGGALPSPEHGALARGAQLTASGRVNVRRGMPDDKARFGSIDAVLQPGSTVTLAGSPEPWLGTSFYWALVTY